MSIFDVSKDDLLRLSDEQLEEFIARLAEAEVASHGLSPSCVRWSGSINSPDGGVDVRVNVGNSNFKSGYIPRANTIFQAKKHTMQASDIAKEMRPKGTLRPAITKQVQIAGGYIIVSLADDCSEPFEGARLDAMQDVLKDVRNADCIQLGFYDRSKLSQWLRQHPSVAIWVRSVLGQPLSGWQPYGRWTNPPADADDSLILETGVSIILPSDRHEKLSIEDAIAPMRKLVWSSRKAIRIVGLSGVGKTRIVQALFDETVGEQPLDRTSAIYADIGAEPDPSARAMLDRLIEENRTAVLVLDNCPSDLHGKLAPRVASVNSNVCLITVEYDIRDDKPQTTEVVHIEAHGPEIAERLLLRRYPKIGPGNAHRIAEFADGNARVALAVAERVEVGESLAHLSDADLFDRLFTQRNEPDGQLRRHAQLLALVYSFSVEPPEAGADELAALGSIQGVSRDQLFSSVAELLDRQVAQQRSHWRAILPHAVANRLAAEALKHIPPETLRSTFETPGRERLLMSFAHRLGLMHEHDAAKSIVRSWLSAGGHLGSILALNESNAKMLEYVAPTAPDAVLDRLAVEIESPDFAGMSPSLDSPRLTILNLLTSLAYEQDAFDRCVNLLLRVADYEDESNNDDAVRDRIIQFFQPYLSGTHASLDQRITVLRDLLKSGNKCRQSLGFRMLATALSGPPWTSMGMNDFGARPRDFGFKPNYNELAKWYCSFIDIAVEYGLHENDELAQQARQTLARGFRGLWRHPDARGKLVEAAQSLNDQRAWVEGWKAVRKAIFFDHTEKRPGHNVEMIPPELKQLEELLAPSDLISGINTYVLGQDQNHWNLDEKFDDDEQGRYDESTVRLEEKAKELGIEFAYSGKPVATLGTQLFSDGHMPYRWAFGRGLAAGAHDKQAMWDDVVGALKQTGLENFSFALLAGFIEQLDSEDRSHAQRILDQCLDDPKLCQAIVGLHPTRIFDEGDLDRCIRALESPTVGAWMYGDLLWRVQYASLPARKLLELAIGILGKPDGEDVLLRALAMKLHGGNPDVDILGMELRRLGLIAATRRLLSNSSDPGGSADHDMKQVLQASLRFGDNEPEKSAWFDAIFDVVDNRYGILNSFNGAALASAQLMPEEFLNRVFIEDDERRQKRSYFVERGTYDKPVLSDVNVDTLIAWCEVRNDPEAWKVIAAGLQLWVSTDGDKTVQLNDAAVRFLEASPVPDDILRTYASEILPTSWSGSRADIMERRTASFDKLFQHTDPRISVGAREIVEEATSRIQLVRERERREEKEREQRFE